jgi:di/tricarboxylate transporter
MAFGNQVLWLVMFAMIFCYAIEKTGLLPIIARKILNIKFARRGPWSLAFIFMIAAMIMGFLTTNALTVIVILWKVFEEMVEELKIAHDDPYVASVLIMIVIAATAGSVIAPYTGFVLISFGFYNTLVGGIPINTLSYAGVILAINLAIYLAFIFVFKYLLKINVSFEGLRKYSKEETSLNMRQKIMLGLVLLLAICMMLPHVLPEGSLIREFLLTKLGGLGVMISITIIFSIISNQGETFLDMSTGFKEGIPWGLFMMVGTALMTASVLADESLGITEALMHALDPILKDKSLFILLTILSIFSMALTNILNNNACLAIFAPISIVVIQNAGGNPQTIVILLALTCMLGYITPGASAMGALLNGHEWLNAKQIYKYGGITFLIMAVVLIAIGIPLVKFVFV